MISILIPIYNWNVIPLVKSLQNQAEQLRIDYEIICIDDLSKKEWKCKNEELHHYFNVNYIELSENLGRARIRNWLVKLSRYENLLFLDCDSKIISDDFLSIYIQQVNLHQVIYGGRKYSTTRPESSDKIFHWKYGAKVEYQNAKERNKKPSISFMSNNFAIKKEIMEAFPFDEEMTGYGYEDLAFAYQLQQNSITISHIENPTEHLGIESTKVFLQKTEHAIQNLILLEESKKIGNTKLIKTYEKLQNFRSIGIVYHLLSKWDKVIEKQLYSSSPSMVIFNLWKLKKYIEQKNRKASFGDLS